MPSPAILVRLDVPEHLLDTYTAQADSMKVPVEALMADRLQRYSSFDAQKPIYFDDVERQELERLIGKNVSSATEVLRILERNASLSVGTARVTLKPNLLARLKSRCFVPDFETWLSTLVVQELERFAGLR